MIFHKEPIQESPKYPSIQSFLMLKIIMLGLVLVAIALSGVMSVAMSVASTEIVPSPLQQVRDGVPIGEIVCSEDRVLMTSPSGMPACVFEESVLELETRGFEFIGEPFDMFPIKSSNAQHGSSGIGQISTPPVVSMSVLPSINETAIVEITYTNQIGVNVTDAENFRFVTVTRLAGVVSSGFEMVDSGGVEPWTMYANKDEPPVTAYLEFVPLDVGESKTYRMKFGPQTREHLMLLAWDMTLRLQGLSCTLTTKKRCTTKNTGNDIQRCIRCPNMKHPQRTLNHRARGSSIPLRRTWQTTIPGKT